MAAELATTIAPVDDAARLLQAEGIVRGYCSWHIAPSRADSVTVRGNGSAVITLRSLHVTDVTSVTCDGTLLDSSNYAWSEAGVLTRLCGDGTLSHHRGGWWESEIVVEFTHGYAEVPAEVTGIVQAIAQRAADNPGSRPRTQDGPFADTFSQIGFNQAPAWGLLDAEKEIASRYKLPTRA